MRYALIASSLLLAGCQTAADVQASEDLQMRKVIGLTMAQFTARTGLVPRDMMPTATGRTFVVEGRTVTLVTPGAYGAPTVAASQTCRILLDTFRIADQVSADSWAIKDVTWSGPCANSY
jgi:hypothetical protein